MLAQDAIRRGVVRSDRRFKSVKESILVNNAGADRVRLKSRAVIRD
jgi:hypothetical protein